MWSNDRTEGVFGGPTWQLEERRRSARQREWMLYSAGGMIVVCLPLSWLIHGYANVRWGWDLPLAAAACLVLAQWPAHVRRKAERDLIRWRNSLETISREIDQPAQE